jgi:ABC-2 type transport system ATP-binding protein
MSSNDFDPAVLVEARNLTKVFRVYHKKPGVWGAVRGLFRRTYSEKRAVDAVNFSVREGECVGFLGPNGAGKTTVLKMLSGLVQPTAGEARVLGFSPWQRQDAMKRQFALLMGQKNSLWWDLPARESLELNRVIYGIERRVFGQIVEELSSLLEVGDKMDVVVRELSLGERMKMELIAALLHSPRVLFLDEPTIGLDVTSQRRVRSFLKRYGAERKISILLTSHYMGDIEELCRRVILIDHGKLFFDGPLSEVVDRFGAHKILTLTFERETVGDFDALGEVLESTPVSVRIRVARHRVAEVCREALSVWPVSDLAVQESSVEEVIRKVFDAGSVGTRAGVV